jgi:hypothetical protein
MICAGGDDLLGLHCWESVHIIRVWNNIEFIISQKNNSCHLLLQQLPANGHFYYYYYYYYYFDLKNYQNFNTFYIEKKKPFFNFSQFFSLNRKYKIITI